ncbi:MAG: hypothetical protein L6R48_21935 [Planctomycetes bacterium]|nr:hypothetical protein [Planctomycetota bacterium]
MLAWLERRLGRYAIPRLGLVIALGQVVTYLAGMSLGEGVAERFTGRLALDPAAILRGEWWRLVSFVFRAPDTHPLFLLMGLWFFWFTSGALEARWGAFRFNCFIALGWLATLAAAAIGHFALGQGGLVEGAWYLGSVFLAFAWLHPDYLIYVFFVLPLKAKWLALVTWIGFALAFVTGGTWMRLLVLAAVANFLAFFGGDLLRRLRRGGAGAAGTVRAALAEDAPFHRCAGCGATERSHPERRFRVCDECRPVADFCEVCLKTHSH